MLRICRAVWSLLFLVGLCAASAFGQQCGVERWTVKTGTDADAAQVDLANPQSGTIADLIALPAPHPIPTTSRVAPTEKTVFVVNATLTDYKLETGATGDSDYHLVLMDEQGNTMVAEIPSPQCVGTGSTFATQIAKARDEFDAQLKVTSSFQTANVPVRVTGVGFFDFFHHQHGAAPNVIELHPVLDIQFNPGPDSNDFVVTSSTPAMHLHGGSTSSVNVVAAPVTGSTAPKVSFSVSGLPAGVTSKFTPGETGKAKLDLSAAATVPEGTSPITVTATGNGRTRSHTIALNTSSAPANPEPEAWEYKMITAPTEQEVMNKANELGADAWELVSVVRVTNPTAWRAFFKRLKKN
ncbi:MAG: hypothetical protein WBL63_13790 [Candidatus Acidiferrum sp.]